MTKHKPTDEDIAHFRAALKDVKPLKKHDRVTETHRVIKKPRATAHHVVPTEPIEDFLSDHLTTTVHADEKLFFTRGGLQHKVIRDLRQGKIKPVDSIDLHKMTVLQARHAVTQFISECLDSGYRCVLIIHGKGKLNQDAPILKNHVNNWLQQFKDVLAFCSAPPKDGGVGAVYVLLRRLKGT